MPTTPIMMILLLVVVMISSFLSSSNNQKPEQSWRFWNLEPIFFYRFVAQGDPERIPILAYFTLRIGEWEKLQQPQDFM